MADSKRVFIFGAGFSRPAGMPLANGLLKPLIDKLDPEDVEMRQWLEGMRDRMAWLSGNSAGSTAFPLNIEEVFHYAYFDGEAFRLKQHLSRVGRGDGPGTAWTQAESIDAWLSYLEEDLRDVIFECDEKCDLAPIARWAKTVRDQDAVLTFNYDTLVERALLQEGKAWNHGTGLGRDTGVPVAKLHGSIDWIVAHRCETPPNRDLLFDKTNENRSDGRTGHVEDDYRLWRCRTREQLRTWITRRHVQSVPKGARAREIGIAGLGAYKELHKIPGLGQVWSRGMGTLYAADRAVVVGFSMSDFDAMAKMQFADVARARLAEKRPLEVFVIDPCGDKAAQDRFRSVFRSVDFACKRHEDFDWSSVA